MHWIKLCLARVDSIMTALERAEKCGTLGKIDRTAQYDDPEFAQPKALLKTVNEQGTHIRGAQKDIGRIQRDLYNLKLRNSIVVAVFTAILVRAPEIVSWIASLSR